MQVFRDRMGRDWVLELNVAQVATVKALTGVDLWKAFDEQLKPLAELLGDLQKVCEVLFALVRRQAAERQITAEQFGEGLAGDSLQGAAEALAQELIDFFPDRARRENLRRVVQKQRQADQLMQERIARTIEAVQPESLVEEALAGRSSPGDSPAVPESIPGPSPSDS